MSGITLTSNPTTISGSVTTSTGAAVYGPAGTNWTLVNRGTIHGPIEGVLMRYGTISNAGGATISSDHYGIASSGNLSVSNAGTIGGGARYGVLLNGGAGSTITNAGRVTGGSAATNAGIDVRDGGSITNAAGGTITGYNGIVGHYGPVVITNAGSVGGSFGIDLAGGGTVTNLAGGTIASSGGGDALRLGGSTAHLTVNPGAVFVGVVDGGTGSSTLELARGNVGQGTLGLGGAFEHFGTVVEDAKAFWFVGGQQQFANAIALGSGAELDVYANSGITATNAYAVTAAAGGQTVRNSGTIAGVGGILLQGAAASTVISTALTSGGSSHSAV